MTRAGSQRCRNCRAAMGQSMVSRHGEEVVEEVLTTTLVEVFAELSSTRGHESPVAFVHGA